MLSGVPVVSIDKASWGAEWGGEDLFEGDEIAPLSFPDLYETRRVIRELLEDEDFARDTSHRTREAALGLFGIDAIKGAWAEFLA
jgi:hypothetical protein